MEKSQKPIPSLIELQDATAKKFGQNPCLWQVKTTQAILKGDWDSILISATGSSKMLTFWMPLLF